MKTKIVLWGENEKDEKILLGIQLVESNNIIRIHTIPEKDATEIFYNQMMNQWREGQEVAMPDSTTVLDRPLSMTDGLLPDNIKTERQDILARAKTEWHFVILSSKLYESYADEIDQIKERINELTDFDGGIWEEMKTFWKKVQNQVQEKNLFREHAAELRTKTNELFDTLKSLKRAMNDEFEKASKINVDAFVKRLEEVEERIEKGLGLQPIFNELKNIQNSFKDTKFTRKHHNDVWKRLDGAFKKVKAKRFGDNQADGNTAVTRLTRRYDGLLSAIEKMERSIDRDNKDKQFQIKRIDTTDGQLELQIRQAKMAMIEERIKSKQAKLDDMLKTKTELEKKIESEKIREAKIAEKREQAKKVKEAKIAAKENIAKGIEEKSEELKAREEKLKKAAEAIKAAKAKRAAKNAPPVASTEVPAQPPVAKDVPVEEKGETQPAAEAPSEGAVEVKEEVSSPVNDAVKDHPEVPQENDDKTKTEDAVPDAQGEVVVEASDQPTSNVENAGADANKEGGPEEMHQEEVKASEVISEVAAEVADITSAEGAETTEEVPEIVSPEGVTETIHTADSPSQEEE